MLADLAAPGGIFDANSNMNYVITVFQVVLTLIFNLNFRKVAAYTTDRENHKYQSRYDNSLIVKRCIFEFSDCFIPLIYLGWWELNFTALRANVISLYMADELRRVGCETVLPLLLQNKSKLKGKVKEELKTLSTFREKAKKT